MREILNRLTEALFPRRYGCVDLDGENINYLSAEVLMPEIMPFSLSPPIRLQLVGISVGIGNNRR